MKEEYDAFVIGTGAAGITFAYKLKTAGMKVAIVDSREYGGTCALRGCIPKKVLAGVANIIDAHNRMLGKGTGEKKKATLMLGSIHTMGSHVLKMSPP